MPRNPQAIVNKCRAYEADSSNPPDGIRAVRLARYEIEGAMQRAAPRSLRESRRRMSPEMRSAIDAAAERAERTLEEWS